MRRALFYVLCALAAVAVVPAAHATTALPTWTAHVVPSASGDMANDTRIACADGGFCVTAIGTELTVLRHGTARSVVEAPLPSGAPDTAYLNLSDVACASANSCVAVGDYHDHRPVKAAGPAIAVSSRPVVETYARGVWTPRLLSRDDVALTQVACNVDHCLAVGSEFSPPNTPYLFLRSGTTWTKESVTFPAPIDRLSYPPVYSGSACAAGGGPCFVSMTATETSTFEPVTYFGRPTATGYEAVRSPVPPGVDPATVAPGPMACPGADDCLVLAEGSASSGDVEVFAERYSDGVLSADVIDTPEPLGGAVIPSGIACPATGRCVAAVDFSSASGASTALLLRLQNGSWRTRVAPLPRGVDPGVDHTVAGVACVSVGSCVAVGSTYSRSDGSQSVAWTWAAGHWSATVPQPTGRFAYTRSTLGDVACSGLFCYGSGAALVDAGIYQPLVAVSPRLSG